ncbi:hypothetical protein MUN89_11910 [Halobacillus salinarum]|uniref:Uncharacterized protein n=1 Tax=Halobacillus salinarum TaxID=2932257 RepID=A0ABY4EGV5_9BACI|nr:hypothetical protein [Halobacillus salinarum]UOQ42677.1 hypothetical protein MUN89_11910 [Halobacillus salinarum]
MQQTNQDEKQKEAPEYEMDVLNLPPRKEVHANKKAKTKWKLNFIFFRVLILIIILLVMIALSYRYWGGWLEPVFGSNPIHQTTSYGLEQNQTHFVLIQNAGMEKSFRS